MASQRSIFEKLSVAFNNRDADAVAALCELPVAFISDGLSIAAQTATELRSWIDQTLAHLDRENVEKVDIELERDSAVSAALCACLVLITKHYPGNRQSDPAHETWVIRHTADGDRVVAVIGLRLLAPELGRV